MNHYTVERVINDNGIGYRWCVKDSTGKNFYPKVNSKDCAMNLAQSMRRQKERKVT